MILNSIDIVMLLLLLAAGWFGIRHGFTKQICIAVSIIGGLVVAAFIYSKLAFLGSGSGARSLLLFLLTLAILFLCSSMAYVLAVWILRKHLHPRGKVWRRVGMAGGGIVAVCTAAVGGWMIATMFSPSSPALLQRQLASAYSLTVINKLVGAPIIFRKIAYLVQPFSSPAAFAVSEPNFNNVDTEIDQSFDKLDQAIARVKGGVVKVSAWGCGSTSSATGFLVGARMIMTNAHAMAGASRISVGVDDNTITADAIWFDPATDVAILRTQYDIAATPLSLQPRTMKAGDIGAVMGYPENGNLQTYDATVLQLLNATGYDIYGKTQIVRSIYAVRSPVRPGSSGSPLINSKGEVTGLVFGNSPTRTQTGYAIAARQLTAAVKQVSVNAQAVGTGECTGTE